MMMVYVIFADNRFDTIPLIDIIKTIEKIKKDTKPDIIFTHHHGDLNIDHRITLEAVLTAFRPIKGETVQEIYSFEVLSSTEWSSISMENTFRPNYFVDITRQMELKMKALHAYDEEMREFPHSRSYEAVEALAKYRGVCVGMKAEEAFLIERVLKKNNNKQPI